MSQTSESARPRDVRHLGDFTTTPRMLTISLMALPIGACAGVVAWLLLSLIGLITNAVFHHRLSGATTPIGSGHPWWLLLSAPILGGLVIGLMARYGSEKIRGHGMPEAIEAILLGGSKIQPRVAILKPVSAAIAIGTGGPFGAEGPIIMTGGALGSLFAQFLRLTADERKTLLVAGSAAGMAATFNSPLAATMLAAELLLFELRPRSLAPVAAAVSVATVVRYPLLGQHAVFLSSAPLHLSLAAYPLCLVSGVISALLAVGVTLLVYAAEDTYRKLPIHWMWWPAIAGGIIGVGGMFVPDAMGVGYNVIDAELTGSIGLGLIVGILIVKTLIWSLALGSGTSGGVLAPVFMIGGALGGLEAHVFPTVGPGFWALIALAGVLGGVMRSPFTGIIFALELTHQWGAVLPLMIGAMTAYGVSAIMLKRSVLTEKIARRGYHLSREYDVDPLEIIFVSEVMTTNVVAFAPDVAVADGFAAVHSEADDYAAWRQQLYPVVDDGQFVGVVTRGDLFIASAGDTDAALADIVRREPLVTHEDQILRVVAEQMALSGLGVLPVLDRQTGTRLVGIVSLQQLLAGRRRDHEEARERERIFSVRLIDRPMWLPSLPGDR